MQHRDASDELKALFSQLPGLAWTTDRELRFVRPPTEKTAHLRGTPIADFFGEAAQEDHAAALAGEQVAFDFERGDRHYFGELRAHIDDAGQTIGVVGVAIDATARAALDEKRWDATKMEVIGRLAGGMAHDFNNVLTIIVSYAQFLIDRFEPGTEGYEDAEIIHSAAKRAGELISKLLTFSRRQVSRPLPTSLNALVEELEPTLRETLGEGIDLYMNLDDEVQAVNVDPQHFDQAVMQLAVNAREAMPAGGKLFVETRSVAVDAAEARNQVGVEPGQYAVLSVSDTGVGMDHEVRSKAFEPFFSTKSKGKGTGLGLSSVYGIVKQSLGNVWVYSEPNKGSTFKIYLPEIELSDGTRTPARHSQPPMRGHESILLVDDDEHMRRGAVRALRTHGYTVHEAGDGAEALEICQRQPDIALMLTDVLMPGQSVAELRERVCALRPDVRVLYMSGHTERAVEDHGVVPGSGAFLPKPFSAGALLDKVRQVLR